MPKLISALLVALLLSACSSAQRSAAGDNPEYFAALSEEQAESELTKVLAGIEDIDEEIRSAESRRDSARGKAASDGSQAAVEGTEAELDTLQVRKGELINRQVQLERRLRDFQTNKY